MLDPRAQEHEIAIAAQVYVGRVRTHLAAFGRHAGAAQSSEELQLLLDSVAGGAKARPVAADVSLSGRIGRMLDIQWWRRNLRREMLRANEEIEHAQGRIRRHGACYSSDHAIARRLAREKANRATLEAMEVVNEDGQACNLLEVADASVSNPKLRRSELMVRCRGFEETAAFMGHKAIFLTITCPSRFHRFNAQGKPNDKWTGETPKDGQAYLNGVWSKIRAEWKRQGFAPYGFRVAEPHHDACPHWHMLLFVPPHQVGWFNAERFVADGVEFGCGVVGVAGAHALADSGGEPGALKHRFTVEHIDLSRGSATGYIAKYISKNIDGFTEAGEPIGLDFASGKKASDGARRVRTWASVWGIRQFQQIGGPSVTVWRELRRLGKDLEQPLQLELFEHPRWAADNALWSVFWMWQGGPDVPRGALTLRPMYVTDGAGKYGDEVKRVKGVHGVDADSATEHALVTRIHEWTVQRAGLAAVNEGQREWRLAMSGAKKLGHASPQAWKEFDDEFERSGAAAKPWTGINNCTADDEEAAMREDFLRGMGGQHVKESSLCIESAATWPARPPNRPPPTPQQTP